MKKRWLRLIYDDNTYIDIDVTHCLNQATENKKFDPEKIFEKEVLILEEDIDKYDRIGIA